MRAAWLPLQMARTCLIRQQTQTEGKIFTKLNIQLFETNTKVNYSAPRGQPSQRGQSHLVPTYQGKASNTINAVAEVFIMRLVVWCGAECPLLAQSGHSILRIVATQIDR
jgi:hypothetical protein